jgi:hypothetical protein
MQSSDIIIATTTFYNCENPADKLRSELSFQTFSEIKKKGFGLIIIDSGSSKEHIHKMQGMNLNFVLQDKKGMGVERRQVIAEAQKQGSIIVWMEPEKCPFVQYIEYLAQELIDQKAEIIVPKRTSLASYPLFQQKTEETLNLFYKNITGIDLDICFGPKIFTKEAADYFLKYDGSFGDRWESVFIPVYLALKDNKKVISSIVNYVHPEVQTVFEAGNKDFDLKRIDQLNDLCKSIYHFWNKV